MQQWTRRTQNIESDAMLLVGSHTKGALETHEKKVFTTEAEEHNRSIEAGSTAKG